MKNKKASMLVVALIILGAIIVTALTLSISSIRSQKDSIGAGRSGKAYQSAENGIEKTMKSLLAANSNDPVSSIGSCSKPSGSKYAIISGTGYQVELKKENEADTTNCSTQIGDIASVKSIGTDAGGQAQRAIEAVVAAASSGSVMGACQETWRNGTALTDCDAKGVAKCKTAAAAGNNYQTTACYCDAGYTVVGSSNSLPDWGTGNGEFLHVCVKN